MSPSHSPRYCIPPRLAFFLLEFHRKSRISRPPLVYGSLGDSVLFGLVPKASLIALWRRNGSVLQEQSGRIDRKHRNVSRQQRAHTSRIRTHYDYVVHLQILREIAFVQHLTEAALTAVYSPIVYSVNDESANWFQFELQIYRYLAVLVSILSVYSPTEIHGYTDQMLVPGYAMLRNELSVRPALPVVAEASGLASKEHSGYIFLFLDKKFQLVE